jgi:hypothetical protein
MLQAQPSEERNREAPLGYSGRTAVRREQCNVHDEALLGNDPQFIMSQHEDSFHLEFEVVNVVTMNISDAARSTQTRQRIGISSGRRIQEVSR